LIICQIPFTVNIILLINRKWAATFACLPHVGLKNATILQFGPHVQLLGLMCQPLYPCRPFLHATDLTVLPLKIWVKMEFINCKHP